MTNLNDLYRSLTSLRVDLEDVLSNSQDKEHTLNHLLWHIPSGVKYTKNKEIVEAINTLRNNLYIDNSVSKWDGVSISEPQQDEEGIYLIYNSAELAWISDNVKDSKGKTYRLMSDIDLSLCQWEPIGTSTGSIKNTSAVAFEGTLDGNGYTIHNLKCSISDEYAKVGLFGYFNGVVKNLTIENAILNSTHYVGTIAAYIYNRSGEAIIENCTVINAEILDTTMLVDDKYDNGDKAGGVVGYINGSCSIKNCKVENTLIKAYRDLGGIVGYLSGMGKVVINLDNNKVDNVTLIQDTTNGYKELSDIENHYGEEYGWSDNGAPTTKSNNIGVIKYELI